MPGDGLLHPVAIAAVALLILNDHVLKSVAPGAVTGKLSDVAGLVFFPLALVSAWELVTVVQHRWSGPTAVALAVAAGVTSVVFVACKVTTVGNALVAAALGWLQWIALSFVSTTGLVSTPVLRPVRIVADPTDLLALIGIALGVAVGLRRVPITRRLGR
jgi:hypothetical protein